MCLENLTPTCPYLTITGIAGGFEEVQFEVEAMIIILEASDESSDELPGVAAGGRRKPGDHMHRLPPGFLFAHLLFWKLLFFGAPVRQGSPPQFPLDLRVNLGNGGAFWNVCPSVRIPVSSGQSPHRPLLSLQNQ